MPSPERSREVLQALEPIIGTPDAPRLSAVNFTEVVNTAWSVIYTGGCSGAENCGTSGTCGIVGKALGETVQICTIPGIAPSPRQVAPIKLSDYGNSSSQRAFY